MEAKDTVMSRDQIAEVVYMAVESPDRGADESWKSKQRNLAVAQAQAEISFSKGMDEGVKWGYGKGKEAGIREVVEWVAREFGVDWSGEQEQLKEWGIEL